MSVEAQEVSGGGPHWLVRALVYAILSGAVGLMIRGHSPTHESVRVFTTEIGKSLFDEATSQAKSRSAGLTAPPRANSSQMQSSTPVAPPAEYSPLAAEVRNRLDE